MVLGCGGATATNGSGSSGSGSIALSADSTAKLLPPDGKTSATVQLTISRPAGDSNSISVTASGVPTGVSAVVSSPAYGTYGNVVFTAASTAAVGTYPVTLTASDGTSSAISTVNVTVDGLTLTPANSTVVVLQDGTALSAGFTVAKPSGNANTVTVSAVTSTLPAGLTQTLTAPGTGTSGAVNFAVASGSSAAAAGTYAVQFSATDGVVSTTLTQNVTIAIVDTVQNATDTSLGISGHLQEAMSTGFQPSIYNNAFFPTFPSTTTLAALNSRHIRLQPVHATMPWLANSSPQVSTDWSFSDMDKTVQPVLTVGDQSPVFQIAMAPVFLSDSSGHFIYNSANLTLLTQYAQNLVRYYNKGGFDWGGKHFQSASSTPIKWWAIYNEPNLNNITAAQYVAIYNALVPAMLSVDSSLKFVGLELSGFTGESAKYLPLMVLSPTGGGINAQMDAISTHYYATCKQADTDATVFADVQKFVTDLNYIHAQLKLRSDLANVPVWVTENNVNSDYPLTTGYSSCTPTIQYVLDTRGTNQFMTSWRPLVFSQLGKAGNTYLHHFLYEGSGAYGEVNSGSNAKYLSYWADYWLARTFPWDGTSTGALILKSTTTEPTPTVDLLVARNADNTVSLMVTNYAVANSADDAGSGAARTVVLDTSALGTFKSATRVDVNGSTSLTTGPTQTAITPAGKMTLTFTGYGTSMFVLTP